MVDIEKLAGSNIGKETMHVKKLELKSLGGNVSECPRCKEGICQCGGIGQLLL